MKVVLIGMLAAVAAALALVSLADPGEAKDNAKLQHCRKLHTLISRYQVESVPHHNSSARFRADLAEALCESGDYDRGIAELETEIHRARLPLSSD